MSKAAIRRGASDLLRIAPSTEGGDDADPEYNLLYEYIQNYGDTAIHFSSDSFEIVDSTPTPRLLVVTERAIYKFPQSATQTGLFFDARFIHDKLVQVIAIDNDDSLQGHGLSGLDAQIYTKDSASGGATVLAFTLNFGQFPARRQAFFLAMSLVKPQLPILQKRRVNPASAAAEGEEGENNNNQGGGGARPSQQQHQNNNNASQRGGSQTPQSNNSTARRAKTPSYMSGTRSSSKKLAGTGTSSNTPTSPAPKQPSPSSRNSTGGKKSGSSYSPAGFRSETSGGGGGANAAAAAAAGGGEGGDMSSREHRPDPEHSQPSLSRAPPPKPISEEEFERNKKQLHVLLMFDLSPANQLDMLDPGWRTNSRPSEEAIERMNERDEVRAMIYAKEDKIELDAQFREKNPKKALTKFARGVCLEFDKAHEERFVPPELSDEMLLGPALFPLWKQWKISGGLLKVDRSGGADEDQQWTLFDTNDLISSIRAQEDALLGQIGKKSMIRLQQMRELVEREKKMFMNRNASVRKHRASKRRGEDDEDEDDMSDTSSNAIEGRHALSARKTTKPVPFRLSCSSNLGSAVKRATTTGSDVLDLGQVMKQMKDTLMVHRAKLHDLQKTQLVREINRHAGL